MIGFQQVAEMPLLRICAGNISSLGQMPVVRLSWYPCRNPAASMNARAMSASYDSRWIANSVGAKHRIARLASAIMRRHPNYSGIDPLDRTNAANEWDAGMARDYNISGAVFGFNHRNFLLKLLFIRYLPHESSDVARRAMNDHHAGDRHG